MADPVASGSDAGYEVDVDSTQSLPPCPSRDNTPWDTVTVGDAAADPYPDR